MAEGHTPGLVHTCGKSSLRHCHVNSNGTLPAGSSGSEDAEASRVMTLSFLTSPDAPFSFTTSAEPTALSTTSAVALRELPRNLAVSLTG